MGLVCRIPSYQISFGAGVHKTIEELLGTQNDIIEDHAREYEVPLSKRKASGESSWSLIYKLREKTGQKVVSLIDEYDKPILDNIENPEWWFR